jgi:hypothetical protein
MAAKTTTIQSVAGYVQWVEESGDRFNEPESEPLWFRGLGDATYKLVPSLYRSTQGIQPGADDELRGEFSRRALPMMADRPPRNDWEWYFVMQHYGAPTRLLDWTDSALVALYFALTSWTRPPDGEPRRLPAVWALNPWTLNRRHGECGPVGIDWDGMDRYLPPAYSRKRLPKYPIALDPILISQRMLVQHSHFTIAGWDQRGLDKMPELKLGDSLIRAVIDLDGPEIAYMLQSLSWMGISETSIFPDLGGLARELRLQYQLDRNRD